MTFYAVGMVTEHDTDEQEARELSVALTRGIAIGTPVTFVVFFLLLRFLAETTIQQALVTSVWAALIGGGFYGGLAGLLHVSNKHGH